MEYEKIELDDAVLKQGNAVSLEWLKTHCLESEITSNEQTYSLYFKFGSTDAENEFNTDNFSITRDDAGYFTVGVVETFDWVRDGEIMNPRYRIDSLWFASDGNDEECKYVIKAVVYRIY